MTWQKIKAIQRNLELHWIGLFVLLILGGCLGEILNYLGHPFIRVNDLDAVSMVILQIQGTIDTLSIAILALLGGRITESYMGLSLIDYVMNKKPVYLNQKKIISCLIMILSTSVFFHLIELYNLVFAWFLISEGLILLSVTEIYEVFSGHVEIENEIKSYLMHQIKSETYSKKLNIVHGFCNGWKTVIISQSEPKFETYRQIFSVIFETIFLDESPNSRLELQKYTHHIIYTLLSSETLVSKRRGVKLVHEIYKKAWTCIRSNEDKVLHFQDVFHLFREISDNLQNVVVQLPIAVVERELRWHSTAEHVLLVNFWVAYDPQNPYELKNLGYFASTMGTYIAKNRNKEQHAYIWEEPLRYLSPIKLHSPANYQAEMEHQWTLILFQYAVSLVVSDMLGLLEKSLYLQGMTHIYPFENEYYVILVLKIHCYIYYIAEYEDTACVSEQLKKSCREFLQKLSIRRSFSHFLYQILNSKNIFNEVLEKRLYDELRNLEFFPQRENSKMLKMESVVRNFVVFITIYLFCDHDPEHLMDQVFSDEMVKFYLLQYLQNPDITIERLEQFLMLLSDAKEVTADPEQRKAKIKYAVFERKVKHRLKEIEVAEASRRQHDEDFISKEAIAMLVQQYIEEKFSPIISEEAKGYGELRIHCLQIDIPSDMLTEESVKGHYDDIASGLIGNLRNVLYKSAALQVVYRNSFQDDFGYIAHLNNRSASVLIGSNRAFKTRHYSNCGLLDRYLSNRKVIFAGYFNWGLLLNEGVLQICVKDIHIAIRPALIKDSDAKYDSEKNVYVYNPSGISLEFTREELADYLRHKRKIVNIVVQLYIKKSEGIIGELLCGD